jgi:hypothetical protein
MESTKRLNKITYRKRQIMLTRKLFIGLSFLFTAPLMAFAWGGPEHNSITAAAVSVLSPAILSFLGSEAVRLIKIYCNYPDFNWAVYGTCSKSKDGNMRLPDTRRDFEAPHYCGFDEFTGTGEYYGHGPEIGKESPCPDEHSTYADAKGNYSSSAVFRAFGLAQKAFEENRYFDAIRYMGVATHYMEDNTPPPHALNIPGGSNPLHHEMEKIDDHSGIGIKGYSPSLLADTIEKAREEARKRADSIALKARELATEQLKLLELGNKSEAEQKKYKCANMAAEAVADMLYTFYELNKTNLPVKPEATPGRNLLFNPSFDIDEDGDLQPDGWIREWNDLKCPYDMHLWDRISVKEGACVRIYGTSEAGASWRTSQSRAVPVKEGQKFLLKGKIRPQASTGESYIALRFQDAEFNTLEEVASEKLTKGEPWREISVSAEAPENAVDVLAVCASEDNQGSVLFDDMSLELVF